MTQTLIALVIALAGFGSAWQIQTWRYGAKETENVKQALLQTQASATRDIRRANAVIAAQSAATGRLAALARTVDAAGRESRGLRDDLAAANARLATDAYPGRIAALSDVLSQCTDRYTEVAGKADGHANDAKALTDAWPRN